MRRRGRDRRAPRSRVGRSKRKTAPEGHGYSRLNLATWERIATRYEARHQRSLRRERGRAWGLFRIPERRLRLLGEVRGKRVLELGCGAADWSAALAREGARVVGLDFSPARLRQARARMRAADVSFPLVRGRAERMPFPTGHFDIVLSDYGATTFADPRQVIPEAARVLRNGGILVFAHASPFRTIAEDVHADRLVPRMVRDYFGLRAIRTPDGVEFQLPYGVWIELFTDCGFAVERLVEPVAPTPSHTTYLSARDRRWARRWPAESIWKLRKAGRRGAGLGRGDRPARRVLSRTAPGNGRGAAGRGRSSVDQSASSSDSRASSTSASSR